MFKERHYSTKSDFKTGFFCKFFLFVGIILLISFIALKLSGFIVDKGSSGAAQQIYDLSQSTVPESMLAISLIFIFVSVLFYFLNKQFAKLAQIAEEIENTENLEELE